MKPFGQWFNDFGNPTVHDNPPEPLDDMPDCVYEKDGGFVADCCVCGRPTEVDREDFDKITKYDIYCGGSPSCCP